MNNLKIVRTLALLATFMAFTVVMLGAATRLLDAGLGCPDWPGCYGRLVVPQAHIAAQFAPHAPLEAEKAWMEMIHRYLAASLGLMAMLLVFFSWRARIQAPGLLRWTSLLLALVIVQGAFGAWTVTLKLWPQVVTLHLLGGFSCLLLLSFIAWRVHQPYRADTSAPRSSGSRRPAIFCWHWCCWYCR
jgi:cytochrome c oxidase assembly protein subunit 15